MDGKLEELTLEATKRLLSPLVEAGSIEIVSFGPDTLHENKAFLTLKVQDKIIRPISIHKDIALKDVIKLDHDLERVFKDYVVKQQESEKTRAPLPELNQLFHTEIKSIKALLEHHNKRIERLEQELKETFTKQLDDAKQELEKTHRTYSLYFGILVILLVQLFLFSLSNQVEKAQQEIELRFSRGEIILGEVQTLKEKVAALETKLKDRNTTETLQPSEEPAPSKSPRE